MTGHLAERDRPALKSRLQKAWALEDHQRALDALRLLAGELDHRHPGAAASLREGRIIGYTDLAKLTVAVERDLAAKRASTRVHAVPAAKEELLTTV